MLLPSAHTQHSRNLSFELPRDTPPLSMDQSPSWHSLPILFQAYSFIGMKNGTKASSCWTRPGNCPTSHPKNLARTSIIVFRRTWVQRIRLHSRQQPAMQSNTRGNRGEGDHWYVTQLTFAFKFKLFYWQTAKLQNHFLPSLGISTSISFLHLHQKIHILYTWNVTKTNK